MDKVMTGGTRLPAGVAERLKAFAENNHISFHALRVLWLERLDREIQEGNVSVAVAELIYRAR